MLLVETRLREKQELIREIKMPHDWFRCVFVIFLNVTYVFSESVAQSSSCFANV